MEGSHGKDTVSHMSAQRPAVNMQQFLRRFEEELPVKIVVAAGGLGNVPNSQLHLGASYLGTIHRGSVCTLPREQLFVIKTWLRHKSLGGVNNYPISVGWQLHTLHRWHF